MWDNGDPSATLQSGRMSCHVLQMCALGAAVEALSTLPYQ